MMGRERRAVGTFLVLVILVVFVVGNTTGHRRRCTRGWNRW
ncbi:hypothetical protein HSR122_0150 [Halapricum desulfuricans]|uniref:Uncharacterized protein n=1 Tax=Halapricum desulfuricans TaxID=2841257 RepID=A0A897N4A5_9EURY|nr:hypothetical protein HSR122_0150 [Halapricum desulfuricans]